MVSFSSARLLTTPCAINLLLILIANSIPGQRHQDASSKVNSYLVEHPWLTSADISAVRVGHGDHIFKWRRDIRPQSVY